MAMCKFSRAVTTAAVLLLVSAPVWAGPLYWDGTSTSADADGGNGTWDSTTPNWMDAPAAGNNVPWDSTDAVFGASAGSINVDSTANVSANSLQFNTTGYTITGTGSLTMTGAGTIGVSGSNAATLGTGSGTGTTTLAIGGTANVTKTGTGLLVLNDSNTFTGGLTISAGTVSVNADSRLGAAGGTVSFATNSALRFTGTGAYRGGSAAYFQLGTGTAIFDVVSGINATISLATGTVTGGAGSILQKVGAGTLTPRNATASATVGYEKLLITEGSVDIFQDSNLGKIPASPMTDNIMLDGGRLRLYSNPTPTFNANRGITILSVGTIQNDSSSGIPTFAGPLSGASNTTLYHLAAINGAENWTTNSSTFAGNLVMISGRMNANNNGSSTWGDGTGTITLAALSAGSVTIGCSATNTPTIRQKIVISPADSTGTTVINATGVNSVITLQGPISGGGAIFFGPYDTNSLGTVAMANVGTPNSFTGTVTIVQGKLRLDADNQIPNTVAIVTNGNLNGGTATIGTFNVNGRSDLVGSLAGTGTVLVGAGSLGIGGDDTNQTYAGVMTGTGNVYKSGNGVATFSNANNAITGTVGVLGGNFALSSTGAFGNVGTYDVNSGTLDLSQKANLTIASGKVLKGNGNVVTGAGGVILAGKVSPGESAGKLHTTSQTWQGGASYDFEMRDSSGAAGTGYDSLSLDIGTTVVNFDSTLTTGTPMTINIKSILANGASGNADNFNKIVGGSWIIADANTDLQRNGATITDKNDTAQFNPAWFTLDTTGFTNDIGGGSFRVDLDLPNHDVLLVFNAVPEPSSGMLLLMGAAGLLTRRARARRVA